MKSAKSVILHLHYYAPTRVRARADGLRDSDWMVSPGNGDRKSRTSWTTRTGRSLPAPRPKYLRHLFVTLCVPFHVIRP